MLNRRQFVRGAAALSATATVLPALHASAQTDATPGAGTPAAGTPVAPFDISTLPLRNSGQLTIHTDQPVFPPWFIDNDPSNGQGFEAAVRLVAVLADCGRRDQADQVSELLFGL